MNLSSKTTEAGRPARSLNYNHEDVDAKGRESKEQQDFVII